MNKTPDPTTLAPEAMEAVNRIIDMVARLDELRRLTSTIQTDLDKAVVDARLSGVKYRDIAAFAGRSVAWVQGALQRGGYETRGSRAAAAAAAAPTDSSDAETADE